MPIESISNLVRLPRLGKIHLGVKVEQPGKSPYPKATDYFVCPPEVTAVFGEKPTELDIMFPSENPENFAPQWLRAYSLTQGLICIGDGISAKGRFDTATGTLAGRDTQHWEWRDGLTCDPQECPEYEKKRCRRVLNLLVFLPSVPGIGCYQIDSSSFYSIININSMIQMLKATLGRCSMIPLTLALGPIEVTPEGMAKKTVYVMHIKKNVKLADLARLALLPPAQVLLPEPDTDEAPADLYPPEILAEAEAPQAAPPAEAPAPGPGATTGKAASRPAPAKAPPAEAAPPVEASAPGSGATTDSRRLMYEAPATGPAPAAEAPATKAATKAAPPATAAPPARRTAKELGFKDDAEQFDTRKALANLLMSPEGLGMDATKAKEFVKHQDTSRWTKVELDAKIKEAATMVDTLNKSRAEAGKVDSTQADLPI